MGGQAFVHRGLKTPRMPPAVYEHVLITTQALLRQHYTHVASPIEAPGKSDYGDIDILVCGALDPTLDPAITPSKQVAHSLASLLNAKSHIQCSGNTTMNFAIPWPSFVELDSLDSTEALQGNEDARRERSIQLDIQHCPTPDQLTYTLFHHAHGDLWNILGTTIRSFGLTLNDRGLFLRIPSLELTNRKKSFVLLTSDPDTILKFLGLDEARFWKRFGNVEEMFEFGATCRMFWVKEIKDDKESEGVKEGDVIGTVEPVGGQEGGTEGKKKLKHNDRQRMGKRAIFAKWIDEFIPACREKARMGNPGVTRESVRDDAFEQFEGVRKEYEQKEREWTLERHKDMVWRVAIKESVPVEGIDPPFRAASIRMLKQILMEKEEDEGKIVEAAKTDENSFWDAEKVRDYVQDNWERLGKVGLERQHQKAIEGMKAKAEKKERAKALQAEMELMKQQDRQAKEAEASGVEKSTTAEIEV